jgi:hypothetical protein
MATSITPPMSIGPPPSTTSSTPVSILYDPYYRTPFVNYTPYNLLSPLNNGYYTDLNKDKTVIKTIVKYFYYKIIDKWLYSDLLPLLGFVTLHDGKAQLIKNLDNYKTTVDSNKDIERKIDFMENILITRDMVKDILKKIVSKYDIKWYQLYKHEDTIKKKFYKYIKEELENAIEK